MDYSDGVFWKTKEESREAMYQAAEFKIGDTIMVCRNQKFYHYHNEEKCLTYGDARLASGQFTVIGITNHRGTWSGTWKYKVRVDNKITYIDFGIASKPGRCPECKHRLTRLMGLGACPGYFEPVEEEDLNSLNSLNMVGSFVENQNSLNQDG